ncbi:MAG: hypothetical protein ABMA15_26775 [Vicinamibacterales bacterium]
MSKTHIRPGGAKRAERSAGEAIAQRIQEHAAYAGTVRQLGRPAPKLKRLKTFKGPLPGIYIGKLRDNSA